MSSNGSNPVPLADLVEDTIGGLWGDAPDSAQPDNIDVLVIRGADFRDWASRRAANAARRVIPRRALARRELRLGDLVLEVSGGGPFQPVGRVVVIDGKTLDTAAHPLIPSNFCRRIRLKPGANPYFVKRQLDSLYRNGNCDQYQTSTTNIRNLQVDAFLDGTVLEMPAPEEQERLTKFADDLDSRTTSLLSHLSLALNYMQRFRQSILAAACSGRLTADWRDAHFEPGMDIRYVEIERRAAFDTLSNSKRYLEPVPHDTADLPEIPETWNWLSADAVSSQITDGEHIQPPYQATGFPMLSAKHVRDGFVDPTGAGVIAATAFEQARKRCAPAKGDLLVVSVGATTGRTAIVQIDEPFAIVRSVLLLKPLLQRRFLLNWLRSQWAFDWMRQASGASAQPHLYIRDLRRLPVPVPQLAEQEEIVRVVDTLLAQADSIEQRLRFVATNIDKVSNAVLGSVLGYGMNGAAATASAQG